MVAQQLINFGTKKDLCQFCGMPIIRFVKRGRPKFYCGSTCRLAAKYWHLFCLNAEQVHFEKNAPFKLKSELTSFANGFRNK